MPCIMIFLSDGKISYGKVNKTPRPPRLGFRQEDGACLIYSAVFQMVVSVSE